MSATHTRARGLKSTASNPAGNQFKRFTNATNTLLLFGGFRLRCFHALFPSAQSAPTFNLLYAGGEPWALVEVQPGRFFGLAGGPAIFSITSTGDYQPFYQFPVLTRYAIAAVRLTPALNGQVYGSVSNLGVTAVFSELFSVAPDDNVTTHSYKPTTQALPFDEIQSPYGLYAFLGTLSSLGFGGASLLGTTAVSFNGTPAEHFAVASSQGVFAEVPNGATSGTTPNGSFTTTSSFTVE